ncbi:MAG: phosphoribosylformylglycinamidine synthase subunit PurQ [Planctomycetaceae bacterium]|jgi:phosphoribosylformylglycinamidine synthase|nr:phosphoribosylformylglycinamidine synthase subunit PurQ [Planctomycetaceae bacterium]
MVKVLILRAPGINCDVETRFAFQSAGADRVDVFHINRLLESPAILSEYQILCLPGGFSYGDDIDAGKVFASKLSRNLGDVFRSFCDAGKLVLGICNGFQVLLKSGLLLCQSCFEIHGAEHGSAASRSVCSGAKPIAHTGCGIDGSLATLAWNEPSAVFVDRWVHLRAGESNCVFLRGIRELYLPIAHGEGRFVPSGDSVLSTLADAGQLALRYVDGDNPNGSVLGVAGVCDRSGRIFGLMPHPERFLNIFQHPYWTRIVGKEQRNKKDNDNDLKGDGFKIFQNAVSYFL